MTNVIDVAKKCFQDEAQAIPNLIPKLDDNFTKAIELIIESKGKLILTGVGKSGHIGAKIASTMASTGTPAFFVNPLDAFHGDLGMIGKGDVVLAISNSGQTDELLRFIPLLKERNIPIISMSGNPASLLAKYSDCHLDISVQREACPLNLAPTSSTTATLAMGDAIACALMTVRNFQAKDFAQFHPGGSLGRRLLSRVKDYMTSDNLPIVTRDSKISDTLMQISRTKMGIAVVIEDERIIGAVTDGDIRRTMQRDQEHFFQLTVKDLMNSNPKTIKEDAKLSQAEKVMRQHNIKSLIVVDNNNKLVGVIDAFSCI
ncbi:MAG: KpsF/GutQ family sugar-phosphate isomerase [Bacteroidaceae bacterium]|nr:KpsF/GutQ family sugar-phosphate isomerase [Bacteroidaceae bacterium]